MTGSVISIGPSFVKGGVFNLEIVPIIICSLV